MPIHNSVSLKALSDQEQSYHNCIVSLKGKQDNGGTCKDLRPLYIYLFHINDNDVGCFYDQAFLKSRVT